MLIIVTRKVQTTTFDIENEVWFLGLLHFKGPQRHNIEIEKRKKFDWLAKKRFPKSDERLTFELSSDFLNRNSGFGLDWKLAAADAADADADAAGRPTDVEPWIGRLGFPDFEDRPELWLLLFVSKTEKKLCDLEGKARNLSVCR